MSSTHTGQPEPEAEKREPTGDADVASLLATLRLMLAANTATIATHHGMINGNRLTLEENRSTLTDNSEAIAANNLLLRENSRLLGALCAKLGVV